MSMRPKVSIVMPVYNSEQYLKETLDSILSQSYKNLELICVDDGSTDRSLDILQKYSNTDQRITIIKQKNQFAGVARNNGFSKVTGKYVLFLDSDDIFERNMLKSVVRIAEKEHTDIVFFGFYHFSTSIKSRSLMGIPYKNKKITSAKEHKNDLFQIGQGVPWNRLYNVEFVRKTNLQFQALQSNNDVFFSKAIMLYAERMIFLNKRYVNYRIRNANSLQGSYKLSSGNFSKCLEAIRQELLKNNLYEDYKISFEKYVVDSFLLILKKASDFKAFMTICEIENRALKQMNITLDSQAIANNPAKHFFSSLLLDNYNDALFMLYRYMQDNYISETSIESKIGRKLLSLFKIKVYE